MAEESFNAQTLRERILSTKDVIIESVDIPEWPEVNGSLFVRSISGIERENYMQSVRKVVGHGKKATVQSVLQRASAKLAVLVTCDRHGNRVFTQADVDELGRKNARALERIVEAGGRLNGLLEEDGDDGESSKEDAKNDSAEMTDSAFSTS